LAQTKNWERLGFKVGKHYRKSYLDTWKRKNRLEKAKDSIFRNEGKVNSALPFLFPKKISIENHQPQVRPNSFSSRC